MSTAFRFTTNKEITRINCLTFNNKTSCWKRSQVGSQKTLDILDLMSVQTNDVTTANSNVILSVALQLVLVDLAPAGEANELVLLFEGRTSKEHDYVERGGRSVQEKLW